MTTQSIPEATRRAGDDRLISDCRLGEVVVVAEPFLVSVEVLTIRETPIGRVWRASRTDGQGEPAEVIGGTVGQVRAEVARWADSEADARLRAFRARRQREARRSWAIDVAIGRLKDEGMTHLEACMAFDRMRLDEAALDRIAAEEEAREARTLEACRSRTPLPTTAERAAAREARA